MFKWVNHGILPGPDLTEDDQIEFEDYRKELNINRCKTIAYFVLYINFILIIVDLLLYKPLRSAHPSYTYLFYSHVFVNILMIIWLFAARQIIGRKIKSKYLLMCYLCINIIIYWGIFMGLNDLEISGQMLAYIICVLALSIFIYLAPFESFTTYFVSLIILIVGLALFVKDDKILYNNIVNITITILCAYIASNINYITLKKGFYSNKVILSSKKELEEKNLKLKEYEKLRTDFFANISHELRTPLNIIYGSQQMIESILLQRNGENRNIEKYLKMIKQNSYRLTRLVSNLIDMTKIDATIYQIGLVNCDIVGLVEDISMSAAGYTESKGISLIFDTEVEEKIISCDPEKIERIMLNLLSNSIKFTQISGSIFVNVFLTKGYVNISVKDTGIGIPDDMKELIFDRFVQVDKTIKRNREGSGIGLSIVKSLVELHNGSIRVNSSLGQGSEFIVSLPDMVTNSDCEDGYLKSLDEQRIERIRIEFSDIYE